MREITREVAGKKVTFSDVPQGMGSLFSASFNLAGGTVDAPHWVALAQVILEFFEVGHEYTPAAPAAPVPCPDCASRKEFQDMMTETGVHLPISRDADVIRSTLMTGQGRR